MGPRPNNREYSHITSTRTALAGVVCSLCLSMMFLTALFPYFFLYIAPGVCGLLLLIPYYKCGIGTAITAYASVALLCFFITPTKESALYFILFLGYYPILHVFLLERGMPKVLRFVIAFVLFNLALGLILFLVYYLFGWENMEDLADKLIWFLLIGGNITFFLYFHILDRFCAIYREKGASAFLYLIPRS